MELNEFKSAVLKRYTRKKGVVSNCFGVYDAYKAIRRNGWYNIGRPLKEREFYAIIRGINNILAEKLKRGETVKLPYRMGKIELRKHERGVSFKDGKLKVTYPINWNKTLELWYNDEEAHRSRTLVRTENPICYKTTYDKYAANYENQSFYLFKLNKFIHDDLRENLKKGTIDTLW